jgi:hypothetical protein
MKTTTHFAHRSFSRVPLRASPWRWAVRAIGAAALGACLVLAAPVLLGLWCAFALGHAAAWMIAIFLDECG